MDPFEPSYQPEALVLKLRKVEFSVHSVGRVSRPDQKCIEIDGPGAPSYEKAQLQNWRFGLVIRQQPARRGRHWLRVKRAIDKTTHFAGRCV